MYELLILSLLVRFPAHGYLIAKIINDIIGPYAKISNGRLYPLLAKLEESGLIETSAEEEQEQHGERNSRRYRITEAGRERFHALMLDTTSNPGEYQRLFTYKVPVLYLLQPFERLYLIDHYLNYCQAHVLHLANEADDLATHGHTYHYQGLEDSLSATIDVLHHIEELWVREVEWTLQLRQQELTGQQGRSEHVTDHEKREWKRRYKRNQKLHQDQNQNPSPQRNWQ